MTDIRVRELPTASPAVATDWVPIDNGTTRKVSITDLVDVGRPLASQAEAEAGTEPTKAMTPLTTAQAITAQGGVQFASAAQGLLADSALQPDDIGVSVASAAQGALAESALQPATIGTTVQAYSANLDTLAAVTPGAAGLAILADDTEEEVRDYLDPLKGFHADGTTDDTANFTALRSIYPDTDFDLYGKTYFVTAIPDGPFHNGYWSMHSTDGNWPFRIPATGTYKKAFANYVTSGPRYSAWPQDSAYSYNDTLVPGWMEGSNHVGADTYPRVARSYDGGNSFTWFERRHLSGLGARNCFSRGTVQGREFSIVREHTGNNSDSTITLNRLYQKRFGEYRERRLTPLGDFRNMQITVTNGSSTANVISCPKHGLRVGDTFQLGGTSPINGVTVSGVRTVTAVTETTFSFAGTGTASADGNSGTLDFSIEFFDGTPVQLSVDGGAGAKDLTNALYDFAPALYDSSNPRFYFHSFQEDTQDTTGGFFACIVGGGPNKPYLIRLTGLLTGTPSIAAVTKISDFGNETTVKEGNDGKLFGFIRWGNSGGNVQAWVSSDRGATFTIINDGPLQQMFFNSPIPCGYDVANNRLVAVATGNRTRGPVGDNIAGDVPFYFIHGDFDQFLVQGWSALNIDLFTQLYYSNETRGDGDNAVGVPSIAMLGSDVHIFASTEVPQNVSSPSGSPNIIHICIPGDTSDRRLSVQEIFSRRVSAPHAGKKERMESDRFYGFGAVHAMGRVSSAGALQSGHGFSVTKPGTGTYRITFDTPISVNGNWYAFVEAENGAQRMTSVQRQTDGSYFDVFIGTNNTTLFDTGFQFIVFADYDWQRLDWQGDFK